MVEIQPPPDMNAGDFNLTRIDCKNQWAAWMPNSMKRTSGSLPAVTPPLDGFIFNDVFKDLLGLSAIWVPNSLASCSQHAANKHILLFEARSAIELTAGLRSDLGQGTHWHEPHNV